MSGIEHANGHKPLSLSHLVDPNIGRAARPDPADYRFELPDVLRAVVQLRSQAPEDAFSSSYLGTEREGNAILVGEDNLFLTIGYLIAETEHIILGSDGGEMTRAQVLAYDYETGFGLLRGGSSLGARPIALGETAGLQQPFGGRGVCPTRVRLACLSGGAGDQCRFGPSTPALDAALTAIIEAYEQPPTGPPPSGSSK